MSDDKRPLDDIAQELVETADDNYQQSQERQQAFLDTVADEEGAEVLETQCNLVTGYTVPLKAKLSGDIMDRMGALEDRLERMEDGDARAYERSTPCGQTTDT